MNEIQEFRTLSEHKINYLFYGQEKKQVANVMQNGFFVKRRSSPSLSLLDTWLEVQRPEQLAKLFNPLRRVLRLFCFLDKGQLTTSMLFGLTQQLTVLLQNIEQKLEQHWQLFMKLVKTAIDNTCGNLNGDYLRSGQETLDSVLCEYQHLLSDCVTMATLPMRARYHLLTVSLRQRCLEQLEFKRLQGNVVVWVKNKQEFAYLLERVLAMLTDSGEGGQIVVEQSLCPEPRLYP